MKKEDDDFIEQLKQEEIAKNREESSQTNTRKDDDGTEYEWDDAKQAWFPKIDDDFIAKYQMNYGTDASTDVTTPASTDVTTPVTYTQEETEKYWKDYYDYCNEYYKNSETTDEQSNDGEAKTQTVSDADKEYIRYLEYYQYYYGTSSSGEEKLQQNEDGQVNKDGDKKTKENNKQSAAKRKEPPSWFDLGDNKNTNVYVSGLPLDITDDEFSELMNKYGLIMFEPRTKKAKLKLYRDEGGQPKGDGRCCYIKSESVDLALQILDGSELRGKTIQVEPAKFEMKGKFDPSKCKKKLTNKEKRRVKERQEKLFDWHPDKLKDLRPSNEKVIILKNMFDPKDFESDPAKISDVRNEVRRVCDNFGSVKKVVLFDHHTDGVVMVFYNESVEADVCQSSLSGRWFLQRRIIAETWDGKTKYDVEETEEEKRKRLKHWSSFLDDDDKATDASSAMDTDSADKIDSGSGKGISKPSSNSETGKVTETKMDEDSKDSNTVEVTKTKMDEERKDSNTAEVTNTKMDEDGKDSNTGEVTKTKMDDDSKDSNTGEVTKTKMDEDSKDSNTAEVTKTKMDEERKDSITGEVTVSKMI